MYVSMVACPYSQNNVTYPGRIDAALHEIACHCDTRTPDCYPTDGGAGGNLERAKNRLKPHPGWMSKLAVI
jgi:hypothetical protein